MQSLQNKTALITGGEEGSAAPQRLPLQKKVYISALSAVQLRILKKQQRN